MPNVAQAAGSGSRDRFALALVLIVVGAASLALQQLSLDQTAGGAVVMVIGLGCLAAFLATRQIGYLIPAGIMTGLGIGIVVSGAFTFASNEGTGGVIVLGLGLGFASIWVIGALLRVAANHWWPLIPGGILVVVGSALLIGGQAVDLLDYWGVAIIAVGLVVLWRAWSQDRPRA